MSLHAYPREALFADYARSVTGLVILGTPLVMVDTAFAVTALFAVGAGIFATYGLRTAWQQRLLIKIDGYGVGRLAPLPRSIAWRDLRDLRLAYYSTRRDRENGWMQLTLVGGHSRLAIDSRLDGFETIAAQAAAAAVDNEIGLDVATATNHRRAL